MKKKLIENVTIGSDIELFLRSNETRHFVPSFFILDADKYSPKQIEGGHLLSCDNCSIEYAIAPCTTLKQWMDYNSFMQKHIHDNYCVPNNLEMVISATAVFEPNDVKSRQATAIGCEVDHNCYTGKENKPGKYVDTLRCSGLHIHTGYDNPSPEVNNLILRVLELFINVPLLLMEPSNRRREIYGKAGSYREKIYGVEWRSPSNYLASSPELLEWTWNQTQRALNFINEHHEALPEILTGNRLESIINDKDVEACNALVTEYNLELVKQLIFA